MAYYMNSLYLIPLVWNIVLFLFEKETLAKESDILIQGSIIE